jgi:hypothetical protein
MDVFQEDAFTLIRCQSAALSEKPKIDVTALRKISKHAVPQKRRHDAFFWKMPDEAESWSDAKIFTEGLTGISWPALVHRCCMSIHFAAPLPKGMPHTSGTYTSQMWIRIGSCMLSLPSEY